MSSNFDLIVRSALFEEALTKPYLIGVAAVGYEARASYCPTRFRGNVSVGIALKYKNKRVRSFAKNRRVLSSAGFRMVDLDGATEFRDAEEGLRDAIAQFSEPNISMIIDISSMSRSTIGGLLAAMIGQQGKTLEVTFCYALAKYEAPPSEYPPLVEFSSVGPIFSGAPRGAHKPTALILGLGYEVGRSIAAYNRIEPARTWALMPVGDDPSYNHKAKEANDGLFRVSDSIGVIKYDVGDPLILFEKLRSLAVGLTRDNRVVFLPAGPKIGALMTFLVAVDLYPDISVWRMSSGPLEPIFHRVASGKGVAVTAVFSPKEATTPLTATPTN